MNMNYEITIRKSGDNPNFKEEMAKFNEERRTYGYGNMDKIPPSEKITNDVLICALSEKQFEAIRKAALEIF